MGTMMRRGLGLALVLLLLFTASGYAQEITGGGGSGTVGSTKIIDSGGTNAASVSVGGALSTSTVGTSDTLTSSIGDNGTPSRKAGVNADNTTNTNGLVVMPGFVRSSPPSLTAGNQAYPWLWPSGSMVVNSIPGQINPSNTESTSSAATPVSITLSGGAATKAHLNSVKARCSAGTASLTVADNGTTKWSTAATAISTSDVMFNWTTPLTAAVVNTNIVVTLGSCGTSNTGTLTVQGDIY